MILSRLDTDSAERAAQALREGKLVILPTDTIYGFSAKVPDGKARIHEIKGRDDGKPLIQLIADPSDVARYSDTILHPDVVSLWPGPITIIVRDTSGGTTAFRCPSEPWLHEVLSRMGGPIYSTSVNRSGMPPLLCIHDIVSEFGDTVDLIIDGGICDGAPSTILDATVNPYRIIRQGQVIVPESVPLATE